MRPSYLAVRLLPFALLLALGACTEDTQSPSLETCNSKIVGGKLEIGWPAVGAMVSVYPEGYAGSFCTGTLIAPKWVLTAAHCLYGGDTKPAYTGFMVGSNANPTWDYSGPANGDVFPAKSFFIHPNYKGDTNENDIALVELYAPVEGVEPLFINTLAIQKSIVGEQVFFVGFGASNGLTGDGSGVKRSGTMNAGFFRPQQIGVYYDGTGICFGDSGGPGLMKVNDSWAIVGVNSSVAAAEGEDPCTSMAFITRADTYMGWIADKTGIAIPDCRDYPAACQCEASCQANGRCDNKLCQTMNCPQFADCQYTCGNSAGCLSECMCSTKDANIGLLDEINSCYYESCAQYNGTKLRQCMVKDCTDEMGKCFSGMGSGNADCVATDSCLGACSGADFACISDCMVGAAMEATGFVKVMYACFQRECSDISALSAWEKCLADKCQGEMDLCYAPSMCDIRGGDCAAGTSCQPIGSGSNTCMDSEDLPEGSTCVADATPVSCADGLVCRKVGGTFKCMAACNTETDCNDGRICYKGETGTMNPGICFCVDSDKDGLCSLADCNDKDPKSPAASPEVCDGLDNNCDGNTDEGVCAEADVTDDATTPGDDATTPGEDTGTVSEGTPGSSACSTGTNPSPVTALPLLLLAATLLLARRRAR
jgi:uncharacterized protein (TIGR03382 family)